MAETLKTIFYDADPEKTILHTEINTVRHLFFYLKHDNDPFMFIYGKERFDCIVSEIDNNIVTLKVPGFRDKGPNVRTQIHFEALNKLYHFDVRILSFDENDVYIRVPHEIHSVMRRKSKRIPTPSLFMHFTILYSSLFSLKSREQEIESKYPHFMKEVRSDNPSIKLLNYMVTEEALRLGEDYEIVFYTENVDLGPNEYKLLGTKKNIYIADTSRLSSYIDPLDSDILINFEDEFTSLSSRYNELDALKKFENMKKEDSRNFYVSYLYCPIILFNEVIGHFKIYTTYFSKRYITRDYATWFSSKIELFNYGITKFHIRDTRYTSEARETPVVNLSQEALLFELEDEELFNYLHHHRRIKLDVQLGDHLLEIQGEINRTFVNDGVYYLVVVFFKSNPEDMARLELFIYEESLGKIKA